MPDPIRVLVSFGTRPEVVKMAPVVRALNQDPAFEVRTLSTTQHREMLHQVLASFGLSIDYDLDVMRERQTLEGLTARIIEAAPAALAEANPAVVLVHGDTTTTLAVSLASFYSKIPIAHVEAGLRSQNRYSPFPEEMNRRLTSSLATWHYAPTEDNRANLLAEGIDATNVWVTGNTVIDALLSVVNPTYCFDSPELAQVDFDHKRVVGLTCHRRESLGAPMEHMFAAIRDVVENHPDIEVVYPVHKNPVVQEIAHQIFDGNPRIQLIEPLGYRDFSNFMARCFAMITDSGGIQEEAPALNVPVVVLREVTERPEAVEAGCAMLAGTTYEGVRATLEAVLDDEAFYARMAAAPDPYGDGHAAERIHTALKDVFSA